MMRLVITVVVVLAAFAGGAHAESGTLQDVSAAFAGPPSLTIYTAREIVTLDPSRPSARAVAVQGDRILAVGSLDELKAVVGKQPYVVDQTFANQIIVPGLIAQHDHPFLTALTMMSEIIAIEDWVLPSGTILAAKNMEEYRRRLKAAEAKLKDPNEVLITWGYHQAFHGKLTRADLDKISTTRPIIVWHRSCHEFIVNTKALETYGVDAAFIAGMTKSAQAQSNINEGHFWEQGLFGVAPRFLPAIATPDRFRRGLEFMVAYYHANGVTLGCEPGGILSKKIQDGVNAVLSAPSNPFRFYFIPDGKSLMAAYPHDTIAETVKVLNWGAGMTAMMPKQIKLFADGAIYSLAMQVRQPYLDGHEGAWLMDPDVFAGAFRLYWDAGYQIHIHVNGDRGIDMVLDNLELNMRRNPRNDHRTVVIHFAVSNRDQVERIKRLGAIVSGNPYYVTALADKYSEVGLGPERADYMVRMGDVERMRISFSYHSDMPMAPGQPLFLMHCGVNRVTMSGRVAGKDQRVSRQGALKAVTLDAAYSFGLEKKVGSIVPGKLANFTILGDNPVTCDAARIKDIPVWGTVHEGRVLPVKRPGQTQAGLGPARDNESLTASLSAAHENHGDHTGGGCVCMLNRLFGAAFASTYNAGLTR